MTEETLSLTPRQVQAAGYLLFGVNWTTKLAPQLGVSKRFLERVAAAARDGDPWDFPPGFVRDLRAYAEERAKAAREAADALWKESL